MKKPDGGYAFPQGLKNPDAFVGCEGISARDYFAAHAPAEPAAWFEPAMPVKPDLLDFADDKFPVEFRNSINNEFWNIPFQSDSAIQHLERLKHRSWWYTPATEPVREWLLDRAFRHDARNEWDVNYRRERLVQWPYAWADAMLAEREK